MYNFPRIRNQFTSKSKPCQTALFTDHKTNIIYKHFYENIFTSISTDTTPKEQRISKSDYSFAS